MGHLLALWNVGLQALNKGKQGHLTGRASEEQRSWVPGFFKPHGLLWNSSQGEGWGGKAWGRGRDGLPWRGRWRTRQRQNLQGIVTSFLWHPVTQAGSLHRLYYNPHIHSFLPLSAPCRFDAGSGMATIRHPTPLALGQFHTVTLLRSLTQGSLIVGNLAPVNGTSQVRWSLYPIPNPPSLSLPGPSAIPDPHAQPPQGKFQGLDLNEELYLGGYPDYGAIPKAGLSSGFVGEPLPTSPGPSWVGTAECGWGWQVPCTPARCSSCPPAPQAVSGSCVSRVRRPSSMTSTLRRMASPIAPPAGTGRARWPPAHTCWSLGWP